MEELKTNNKVFNSIIKPLITELNKSKFQLESTNFKSLSSKVSEIAKNEHNSLTSHNVQQFISLCDRLPSKPTPVDWRNFLTALYKALVELDNFKILQIEKSISKCENLLKTLDNTTAKTTLLPWFKKLCENICNCIVILYKRSLEVESENISNDLFFYIIQMTTCTKLFFNLFSEEISNKILIIESRRYLIKRFTFIFDGIKKIFKENIGFEPNCGFIQWMDNTLDLISDLNPQNSVLNNLKNIENSLEEVLCHAMSIAQISSTEDSTKIKASIQTILQEFKQLTKEYNKTSIDPNFRNLYATIVSDKLCLLEKRVNNAVLNISLNVFSSPLDPLKKLQKQCEESNTSILRRSIEDLDELIQDFDAHVDCIIQVGLFAIACSTNKIIIAKIRNYLTNLESLECELIPALTSLYMEPSNISCLYANFFINYWSNEVINLRKDVCFIIDPVAFGQVIQEDLKIHLEKLSENPETLTDTKISLFYNNVKVFILVVDASVKDMKLENNAVIAKYVKDLKDVNREVYAARKLLINNNKKSYGRVLNRIKILSTMIYRVIKAFSKETNNSTNSSQFEGTVDKIKNINLNTYSKRGLEILKERSVFKTPKNLNTMMLTKKSENRKMGLTFIRDQISQCHKSVYEQTLDLQITEILEQVTNLADTLK